MSPHLTVWTESSLLRLLSLSFTFLLLFDIVFAIVHHIFFIFYPSQSFLFLPLLSSSSSSTFHSFFSSFHLFFLPFYSPRLCVSFLFVHLQNIDIYRCIVYWLMIDINLIYDIAFLGSENFGWVSISKSFYR